MPILKTYDVIIIGAGAAGLMCAIESGKRGRSVLLIDHSKKPAEKIRISGGGRCNFTNLHAGPQAFLSQNPHFCKSALKQYTQHDFIALVEKHKIPYHEKTLGQLFCDISAKDIIHMLLKECADVHVDLQLETSILDLKKQDDIYHIQTSRGHTTGTSLVVATGSPTIPKMGSTGFAYEIAKQFGHDMVEPRAALVPLTFNQPHLEYYKALAGVALPTRAQFNKMHFDEALLFTHRGLSGPSVLQISSYWDHKTPITIDLYPNDDVFTLLKTQKNDHPKMNIETILAQLLPKRLAQSICASFETHGNIADLPDRKLQDLANHINRWKIIPDGTEGYRTAEVALGGICTKGISSKTMESKIEKSLFFIGECVDVTGHLGGYNFQWAWSSGYVAGQYA